MILVDNVFDANPALYRVTSERLRRQAIRHGTRWSHLWSDTHDIHELGLIALQIGLKAEWLHGTEKGFPHFNVTPPKRLMALRHGAKEYSLRAFIRERRAINGQSGTGNGDTSPLPA